MSCAATTPACTGWERLPSCCRRHLLGLLDATVRILEEAGILFWLDFGSLLGAYREGGIIEHDDDIDLGVRREDAPRILALRDDFAAVGCSLEPYAEEGLPLGVIRVYRGTVNALHLDLFLWKEEAGTMENSLHFMRRSGFSSQALDGLQTIVFEGRALPCPADVPGFLEERYGPDYMTPIRGLDWSAREQHVARSRRPRLGLCMIVRDERRVIGRCLRSVREALALDSWVVVDTGSTDGTPALVEELLEGIPGQLYHRPWRDFAANRTEALALARETCDYLLLLDADMVLEVDDPGCVERLEAPYYLVEQYNETLSYRNVRLVDTSLPWRFVGRTHEVIEAEGAGEGALLDGLRIRDLGDGGCKADKYDRDLAWLRKSLREQPDEPRTVFYLAQTCRDTGRHAEALALYRRRVALGGWDEEVWYAAYSIARLLDLDGAPEAEVREAFLRAWALRPGRAEPLYWLARRQRQAGAYAAGLGFARAGLSVPRPRRDLLFVERPVYTWMLLDEVAVCSYWTGDHAACVEACTELLRKDALPTEERARVEANLWRARSALG